MRESRRATSVNRSSQARAVTRRCSCPYPLRRPWLPFVPRAQAPAAPLRSPTRGLVRSARVRTRTRLAPLHRRQRLSRSRRNSPIPPRPHRHRRSARHIRRDGPARGCGRPRHRRWQGGLRCRRCRRVGLLASGADWVDFAALRDAAEISDSALSKHSRVLEDAGYLEVRKGAVGRRPRTWFRLTPHGRKAFQAHIAWLQQAAHSQPHTR